MGRGMFQKKNNSKKGSKACGVSTNVPCAVDEDIIESSVTSVAVLGIANIGTLTTNWLKSFVTNNGGGEIDIECSCRRYACS